MIDQLSTVTSTAVSVALDALAQRQQLIAANLANVNSANYAARDLKFEDALASALSSMSTDGDESKAALLQLKNDLSGGAFVTTSPADAVRMDAELVRLNETVIRYQALVEGLGKYGSLARMAIAGEIK
jgi:flagellar basal-body rod protein FlgB